MIRRAAFLAAGAAATVAPRALRAADPLKVAIVSGDGAGPAYYAQQLGYFKAAGLDVSIDVLGNGAAIAAALSGGAVAIGSVNGGSLAAARLRGFPLRAIAPLVIIDNLSNGDALVVVAGSPIRTGADLNGKTVATNALKTMQHAGAMSWIEVHGGDPKSVKFIEMPVPAMAAAIDARRIDAGIESEPFTTLATQTDRSLGPLYDGIRKPFLNLAMCATEPWLQTNAATAAAFASAIHRANEWANAPENDRQRRQFNAELTKLDLQLIEKVVRLQPMGTTLEPAMIAPVIDVMVKYGFLDHPVNPSDMIWRPS